MAVYFCHLLLSSINVYSVLVRLHVIICFTTQDGMKTWPVVAVSPKRFLYVTLP